MLSVVVNVLEFVTDLRPKGRGRPQRILLGIWPEAHIQGVIRAVVFRDPQHIKEDPMSLGYQRLQVLSPLNQLQQANLESKRVSIHYTSINISNIC